MPSFSFPTVSVGPLSAAQEQDDGDYQRRCHNQIPDMLHVHVLDKDVWEKMQFYPKHFRTPLHANDNKILTSCPYFGVKLSCVCLKFA